MPRKDHSSAIALALSLLLHGSVLYVCTEVAEPMPATRLKEHTRAPLRPVHSRILIDPPSLTPPPAEARPVPSPEPPVPVQPLPEPEPSRLPPAEPKLIMPLETMPELKPLPLRTDGFGEMSGSPDATAMHSLSGDVPMQARKAEQDQPYISRDPSGLPRPADLPHESKPAGEQKAQSQSQEQKAVETRDEIPAQHAMTPVQTPVQLQSQRRQMDPVLYGPAASTSRPTEPPTKIAMADPPEMAPREGLLSQPGKAALPGVAPADGNAGPEASNNDPAPQTDSESDPFSIEGSAEFRPGKVVARFGRKVKTVRPRLSLAGQYDLISASPNVVLRVRADETGRVREVEVIQSSGSREVDQPCQLAMYEWWFEPPRDAKGMPRPSEMIWTISFRGR